MNNSNRSFLVLVAFLGLSAPGAAQGEEPTDPRPSPRPSAQDQVTGRDWIIDLQTVKRAHTRVRQLMIRAIDETRVRESQQRVEELVAEEHPDARQLLEAVRDLQGAYRAFLDRHEAIVRSIDRGQEAIGSQLDTINRKMAEVLEAGGINHGAQISRAEGALARLARIIREREDAGLDAVDQRREFVGLLQLRKVLEAIDDAGTSHDEALRIAGQVKEILDWFLYDLQQVEQQLAIAGPVLEAEVTLLDLVGYALEAEVIRQELEGEVPNLGLGSELLAGWIQQVGRSRELLSGALRNTKSVRAARPTPSGADLEKAIRSYASEAGYEPSAQVAGGRTSSAIPARVSTGGPR